MTHHAATHPKRIPPPIHDKGSAHKHAQSGRRHSTTEGTNVYIGDPASLGGGTSGTGSTGTAPFPPGVVIDSGGLLAENAGGGITMQIDTAGNVTIAGSTITGSTIRTSGGFPAVTMTPGGLAAYNVAGVQTFLLSDADGSLTVTGASTITGGTFQTAPSGSNPRLAFTGSGIAGYNGSGVQTLSIGTDGSVNLSGSSIITGGTFQTSASNPRLLMDTAGIRAVNALGVTTFSVTNAGFLTNTGGVITGGTVQTSATNPRVVFDTTGLHSYNATGQLMFGVGNDGSFEVTVNNGAIIATTSGVTIQGTPDTNVGARVTMSALGLAGYNASNQQEFLLDSTSGLIEATGIITAQPGSTVPWQTTGFFIGGGNLLYNASGEDPTSFQQLLYMDRGAGVTAGTFQLQYTNTPTSALNWNATAGQVQTALQASGVLPATATVGCTGGPLPNTPITVSIGNLGLSPEVLTPVSQTIIGGSAVVGAQAVLQYLNNVPNRWWGYANGALDHIALSSAYHGGNVLRLTAMAAGNPNISQSVGPFGLKSGTKYSLSAYLKSALAARQAQMVLSFTDAAGNVVANDVVNSSWNTTQDWQRLVITQPVPDQSTRQQIAITGSPVLGAFQLVYNGQTTPPINFNATANDVLSALQTLSNVGSGGVGFATGGPLPGNPVQVTFLPPAGTPTTMMAVNNLGIPFTGELGITDSKLGNIEFGVRKGEGGVSPTSITISNIGAVSLGVQIGLLSAQAGEVFYIDSSQLEVGDAPTSFTPQPDEIVANVIQANMINVAQLSALSADLGQITAGTITGAVFQTSPSGTAPRVVMDHTGLNAWDAGFNNSFSLSAADGSVTTNGGVFTGGTFQTASSGQRVIMDSSGVRVYDFGAALLYKLDWAGLRTKDGHGVTFFTDISTPSSEFGYIQGVYQPAGLPTYSNSILCYDSAINGYQSEVRVQAQGGNVGWTRVIAMSSNGSTNFTNTLVDASGNSIFFKILGPVGSGGVQLTDNNGHNIEMSWTGSVLQWFVDNTAVNCASSVDLKTNIEPVSGALDIVKNLRGVTFNWKNLPFNRDILNCGLIAEEVASAFPSAVRSETHPDAPDEHQLFLDELPLIAVLVESVKELSSRLEHLEQTDSTDALMKLLAQTDYQRGRTAALSELTKTLEQRHLELDISKVLGDTTGAQEIAALEAKLHQLGGPKT